MSFGRCPLPVQRFLIEPGYDFFGRDLVKIKWIVCLTLHLPNIGNDLKYPHYADLRNRYDWAELGWLRSFVVSEFPVIKPP